MPTHREKEQNESKELQEAGGRQCDPPCISSDSSEPAREYAYGPNRPYDPAGSRWKVLRTHHFGQRVKADAENEGADPSKNLGLSVSLQPSLRYRGGLVLLRDAQKIPYSQEGARQQHEHHAADHESYDQMLALALPGNACGIGLA